jgi:hypothetical protein
MKLSTIRRESRMTKLATVEREVNRDDEDEFNRGVNVGTISDKLIRALASEP